jgi:UDP-N-acetylglucosamine 2-epimerase (non-hydrolysing)
MKPGQDLAEVLAAILKGMQAVLAEARPDLVLVHGDTATTFAATLAAYYSQIPVAHVEAGLRTGNLYSPWPEEANRKLTGALAHLHFAPTRGAADNLRRENVPEARITVTGNTVIDALLQVVAKLETEAGLRESLRQRFDFLEDSRPLVLVTGHRRESFGGGLRTHLYRPGHPGQAFPGQPDCLPRPFESERAGTGTAFARRD